MHQLEMQCRCIVCHFWVSFSGVELFGQPHTLQSISLYNSSDYTCCGPGWVYSFFCFLFLQGLVICLPLFRVDIFVKELRTKHGSWDMGLIQTTLRSWTASHVEPSNFSVLFGGVV